MKKFSELSEEILAYEIAVQVQEGNINEEELEELQEALPLIPIAAKLISGGLGAYSAYSAAKNLRKGKYKQAGLDAIGMIPGGKIFKGISPSFDRRWGKIRDGIGRYTGRGGLS